MSNTPNPSSAIFWFFIITSIYFTVKYNTKNNVNAVLTYLLLNINVADFSILSKLLIISIYYKYLFIFHNVTK